MQNFIQLFNLCQNKNLQWGNILVDPTTEDDLNNSLNAGEEREHAGGTNITIKSSEITSAKTFRRPGVGASISCLCQWNPGDLAEEKTHGLKSSWRQIKILTWKLILDFSHFCSEPYDKIVNLSETDTDISSTDQDSSGSSIEQEETSVEEESDDNEDNYPSTGTSVEEESDDNEDNYPSTGTSAEEESDDNEDNYPSTGTSAEEESDDNEDNYPSTGTPSSEEEYEKCSDDEDDFNDDMDTLWILYSTGK